MLPPPRDSHTSLRPAAGLRSALRVYIAAVLLAGGAAAVLVWRVDGARELERPWLLALFALAVALDEKLFSVRLNRGDGQGHSVTHEESLLVCMAFVFPPFAALAALAAGIAVGQAASRRGLLKGTFNVAQFTLSAGSALLLISALAPAGTSTVRQTVAVVVGLVVFTAVNRIAVAAVLALTGASPFGAEMLDDLRVGAMTWAGAMAVGLLAGLAGKAYPATLPLAVVALASVSMAFSGHGRARRERELLRDTVNTSSAVIFSVGEEGAVRAWNPQTERLTGRAAVEVEGRPLSEAVQPIVAGAEIDELLAATGAGERQLVALESPTAGRRWLSVDRSNLARGGFAFIAHDVTARVRAEALAAGQRRLLEQIAAGAPLEDVLGQLMELVEAQAPGVLASTLLVDEDNRRLRHGAAPSLPGSYNAAVDGLAIGPSAGSCGTAAHRAERVVAADIAVDPLWRKHRELPLAHGLRACWSTPVVAGDGDVLGTVAMYLREPRAPSPDELDLGEAAASIARIAIERDRREQAVARAELKYRRLAEELPLGLYVADTGFEGSRLVWRMTYVSPQFEGMLGYSPAEWLAEPNLFARIIHPDDRERVLSAIASARRAEDRFQGEYRFVAKNGRVVWVVDRSVYRRNADGAIVGVEGFLADVTEHKELESQLVQVQKLEAIGGLVGGIAHDFNNMMSAVIGFGDLALALLGPDDPVRSHVAEIVRAGERATDMTRQLLTFARRQMVQPKVLDLNDAVGQSERLLERLLGEDVELVSILDPDLEPVEIDPGQLEQLIVNLAVNARDAMPFGGRVTIETSNVVLDDEHAATHFDVDPGEYVLLSITDTGSGMDAGTQARIFEPFFTTKPVGEGTGLGLATVHGIVKQSGGDISVYSEPDRGTTFKVHLPRATTRPVHTAAAPARDAGPRGSETILIVEDERAVRRLEREVLEARGYRVLESAGPAAALALAERHEGQIDLLLTDVVMPEMSGRDVAERLAPSRPEMKVLYASGYADAAIVRHGVLEPGIDFLAKPFTPGTLVRKVREVLDADGAGQPAAAAP